MRLAHRSSAITGSVHVSVAVVGNALTVAACVLVVLTAERMSVHVLDRRRRRRRGTGWSWPQRAVRGPGACACLAEQLRAFVTPAELLTTTTSFTTTDASTLRSPLIRSVSLSLAVAVVELTSSPRLFSNPARNSHVSRLLSLACCSAL